MNNWLKNIATQIKDLWAKWKPLQKGVFITVALGAVVAVVLLVTLSSAPRMVPLVSRAITDDLELTRITARLDEERVRYTVAADGRVMVDNEATAQRMRALLTREDLIPRNTDPWELFDIDRWTQTDFERNVNLQRSITRQLQQHIIAIDDIDAASVNLVIPRPELFRDDQNPVTASVIITPKPGSDIRENRRKIEGIEKLVQFAVEGLQRENITISDRSGVVLNDFEGMEGFDRLELTRREFRLKQEIEGRYIRAIHDALGRIYGQDRVKVVNIDVDLLMGVRTVQTQEHFPIETVPDDPRTPFSERQFVLSIPRSAEVVEEIYEGTGFNPQGPPGQEGQTPPAYRDLDGMIGRWSNVENRTNFEINTRTLFEEKSPEIRRVTASVALDGVWRRQYDERGNLLMNPDGSIDRLYIGLTDDELARALDLVRNAVGFNQIRGDNVSVQHIQFDRSREHEVEDLAFRRRRQIQMIVLYSLIGVAVLLVSFIVFRLVSREIERRRRLREEELARQHQAMREAALRSAEDEGTEVEMSVEERARLEMQENAINMAREHPEDVAQLIRTWLMEE